VVVAFPHVETTYGEPERDLQRALAEIMLASVRRTMPGVKTVMLTDTKTPALSVDEVLRKQTNNDYWIPWIFEHFASIPGEAIFLDTDVVVQRDLRPLFNVGADIVLTQRGFKEIDGRLMPFLLGVAASRKPELWKEVADRVRKMTDKKDLGWWGGQMALFDMYMEEQGGRGKWNFSVVDCDPFNYTPKTPMDTGPDKWALHYKGRKRKPWMLATWGEQMRSAA
jgi:hypothetical protein